MRYAALAIDYDGTLATAGRVAPETLLALERLVESGRKAILVTGRELDELIAVFPEIDVFDRVVAENGAVVYTPQTQARRTLGDPPSSALLQELALRGVEPISVGRSIVATVHPHETVVLEAIRDLGLELSVVFNKGAVMILPTSMNKASGLAAALVDLGLSPRNVVAIGDAENDHAMLRFAEFGVAVANALPALKAEADRVSSYENGRAVTELADDLVGHDLRETPPRVMRREIVLGRCTDGSELRIPPAGVNVLVAGHDQRASTTLATGLLKRIQANGYQFCALGVAEECAATIPEAIVLGADARSCVADVIAALQKPAASVIVDLGRVQGDRRQRLIADLLDGLKKMRSYVGRPHWIIVEGAERLSDGEDAAPEPRVPERSGVIYLAADIEWIDRRVLEGIDLVVALEADARRTLASVAAAWKVAPPQMVAQSSNGSEAVVLRRDAPELLMGMHIVP